MLQQNIEEIYRESMIWAKGFIIDIIGLDSFEKKKNSLPHFRAKNPRPTINLKLSLEFKASVSEQGLVYRHFDSFLISYALFVPEYRPFIIHVSKFAVEEIIFNTPGSGKDF